MNSHLLIFQEGLSPCLIWRVHVHSIYLQICENGLVDLFVHLIPCFCYTVIAEATSLVVTSKQHWSVIYTRGFFILKFRLKCGILSHKFSYHRLSAADAFLWRDKFMSAAILAGASIIYFVFELSGYTLLSILATLLMITFAVLFVWSNCAALLNRCHIFLCFLNLLINNCTQSWCDF